jgi:hypothetical protein
MVGRTLSIYSTGAMAAAIGGMTGFGWVTQAAGVSISVLGIGGVLLLAGGMALAFGRWVKRRPGLRRADP